MRTLLLATAFFLGAVLAGCSKPEPAAGAPAPDVVTVDSAAVPDSAAIVGDSTKPSMDSTAATIPDSAAKP
jgi:hypothetical protein